MNIVIFSKDRACQLDALLRSFKMHCKEANACNLFVLYAHSSPEFKQGYLKVQKTHKTVEFLEEKAFWLDLSSILSLSPPSDNLIMFLVDDILFKQDFSLRDPQFEAVKKFNEVVALSLRLSTNIKSCYATGKKSDPPKFVKKYFWKWRNPELKDTDWGYPMSLDGNVFRFDSIRSFLLALTFKNPNTLEAAMAGTAEIAPEVPPVMVCYSGGSKLFNVPANRVQETFQNRHENSFSAEHLNERFLKGERIDLGDVGQVANDAVHYAYSYKFEKAEEC